MEYLAAGVVLIAGSLLLWQSLPRPGRRLTCLTCGEWTTLEWRTSPNCCRPHRRLLMLEGTRLRLTLSRQGMSNLNSSLNLWPVCGQCGHLVTTLRPSARPSRSNRTRQSALSLVRALVRLIPRPSAWRPRTAGRAR